MKISVICVYNQKEAVETQLLKSLKNQDVEYEFVGVKNTEGEFSSAAAALNYGAGKANGDILIFSHQDVYFKTPDALRTMALAVMECEAGTIIGTQGVCEKDKTVYSNSTIGKNFNEIIIDALDMQLHEVSCVDEALFGMKKETWGGIFL